MTRFSPPAAILTALLLVLLAMPTHAAEPESEPQPEPQPEKRPNYWRAAVELGLGVAGGTVWYWLDRERNAADWDFPSWRERFTLEAWRFDNNELGINYAWHPLDGAGYHLLARSNDLTLLESFGYGFTASFVWEFLFEFREKVSINDVIVTPSAGLVVGEFFHWLGRWSQGRGAALRWTAGFPFAVHDAMDGRTPPRPLEDITHRFDLSYGVGSGALHELRFRGRLVAIEDYLRPTRLCGWFTEANVTTLSFAVTTSGDETGVDFHGDAMLIGRVAQRPDGAAWIAGTSMAYTYRRERFDDWQDRIALLHLPGLAIDGELVRGGWSLAGSARVSADFGSFDARLHDAWVPMHPDAVEKTILRKEGYYYGWGASGRLLVAARSPWLSVGGALHAGHLASQEGFDRSQEQVTDDVPLSDTFVDADAWVRVHPLPYRVFAEVAVSRRVREARHDDLSGDETRDLLFLRLGVEL